MVFILQTPAEHPEVGVPVAAWPDRGMDLQPLLTGHGMALS